MSSIRLYWSALFLLAGPLGAQSVKQDSAATAPVSSQEDEVAAKPFPLQVGLAGGALSYEGGRREQALGAVVRWAATPWLSVAATPTMVRVREPSAVAGVVQTTSGD